MPNPEFLGQSEKEIWLKIEPILIELLDELKANGKIETVFTKAKIEHIQNIMLNLNQIALNQNLLLDIAKDDTMERANSFLKAIAEFGFTEFLSTHLVVEVAVLQSILNLEVFKTMLLSHLRDIDLRASSFNNTMQNSAPNAWKKLKPFVDNQFRNSLAHGTWAIENKQVVLFGDADLIPYAKLELFEFFIKTKELNVLYACLISVINEKIKTNFFT